MSGFVTLGFFYGVPQNGSIRILGGGIGGQQNLGMNNTALAGVVVGHSVKFILDGFAAPISGGGNGGFTLAPADDFKATMIFSD